MGEREPAAAGPVPASAIGPPQSSSGNSTALAYALTLAEAHYGAAWAWNPARWKTADGGVPWPVFLVAVYAMTSHRAVAQLSHATAIRLADTTDDSARDRFQQLAFPGSG